MLDLKDPATAYEFALRDMRDAALPASDPRWRLQNDRGEALAFAAASEGLLPDDFAFEDWRIRSARGWSVAHEAASTGRPLPENFTQWNLVTDLGVSVADVAFEMGTLAYPEMKTHVLGQKGGSSYLWQRLATEVSLVLAEGRWPKGLEEDMDTLRDVTGNPIVFVAAEMDCLPEGFDQWEIQGNHGRTVAHAFVDNQFKLPRCCDTDRSIEVWTLRDDQGVTPLHLMALQYLSEEQYQSLSNHLLAIADDEGVSVEEMYNNPELYSERVLFGHTDSDPLSDVATEYTPSPM
ncbi:hypothetical protein [Marinobacterium sp. BA1]|uniref:hypothetical protein n=1 Tax=Marinobacterium sp. BA1 TaxID=3138931 RepID=UPI0032E62368